MISTGIVPLFVAIPLAGAFLIALLKRIKGIPDIFGVVASGGTFILSVLFLLKMEIAQRIIYNIGNWGGFNEVLGKIVGIQLVIDGTDPEIIKLGVPWGKKLIKLKRPYNIDLKSGTLDVLQIVDLINNEKFQKIIKFKNKK